MISRRQLLGASLAAGVTSWAVFQDRSSPRSANEELFVRLWNSSTKAEAVALASEAVSSGVTPQDLLSAALLMNLLSDGNQTDIHSMLVIPPLRRMLSETKSEGVAAKLAVWAVENGFDWTGRTPRKQARPLAADSLITLDNPTVSEAAVRSSFEKSASEVARELMNQSVHYSGDPHVAIWASEIPEESLQVPHSLELWCSFARYAATRTADDRHSPIAFHEGDNTSTEEIYLALRDAPFASLVGFRSSRVWEALALLSIEVRLAELSRTGIGVHQVTSFAARLKMEQDGIHTLSPTATFTARNYERHAKGSGSLLSIASQDRDFFQLAQTEPIRTRYAAALAAIEASPEHFVDRVRSLVAEHGDNSHDFKFFQAVVDTSQRLDGWVAQRFLALLATATIA